MIKTFIFPSIYTKEWGKCDALIFLELVKREHGEVLSVSGSLDSYETGGMIVGGQCMEELKKLSINFKPKKKAVFDKLFGWWKNYHLNDMNPGTPEQEAALIKKDAELIKAENYDKAVKYLKSIGLYEVQEGGKTYKYGQGWLFRPIPEKVLREIKELLK